jgi:Carboxypeptidase regulatory-like domain
MCFMLHPRPSLIIGVLLSLTVATVIEGQQVSVSGVVQENAGGPIPGATVTLSGMTRVITDTAGRFHVAGVMPGAHVLTVSRIGYRFYTQRVAVANADVTLTIEMQPQAVALPPVIVGAHDITIKGLARDSATRHPLLQASVTLYPGSRTIGALSGRFSLDHVPAGERVTLVVEAIEHVPETIEIMTNVDTSIVVSLGIDSVGRRMVAEQSRRLARRAAGVAIAVDQLGREDLEHSGELQLGVVLRRRLPYRMFGERPPEDKDLPCVFFDEALVPFSQIAIQPIELIDRVEIYGRQAKMIRVYSKRYVASLMREATLPRITFLNAGLSTILNTPLEPGNTPLSLQSPRSAIPARSPKHS